MTAPKPDTGVAVSLPGNLLLGPPTRRVHPTGVGWRITKKGRLVIQDADGCEIARYKDAQWLAVYDLPVR